MLILGHRGQVGRDICTYLDVQGIPYDKSGERIENEQAVAALARRFPESLVINCCFAKSLNDRFTNSELPCLLERYFPNPVHFSSNAVYGVEDRLVSVDDDLDPFNAYAETKIAVEKKLGSSRIVRGSFLCTGHKLFTKPNPEIHFRAAWNGITAFEFTRLLLNNCFMLGIQNVASRESMTWADLDAFFGTNARHREDLIENKCLLIGSIESVRDLDDQLIELRRHLVREAP